MPSSPSDPSRGPLRVVVVDDHPVVRRGLVDVLTDTPTITICGQASTLAEAVATITATTPDVVLLDLSLGQDSGLDVLAAIRAAGLKSHVLVMSAHDERLHADRVLRAGALGYIMKNAEPSELVHAVRRVGAGRPYTSPDAADRILSGLRGRPSAAREPLERLSNREREVFALVGQGLTTRAIASQLDLSVKTIESHYARLKEKLGASTVRELIRLAVSHSGPDASSTSPAPRDRRVGEPR